MPTHYRGDSYEIRALNMMIKVARGSESFLGRLHAPIIAAGLTPAQFGILDTLYHLGPMKPSQLAAKHLRSRNNFTSVIDGLEKNGFVTRRACIEDRRGIWVHITAKGTTLMDKIFPGFVKNLAREAGALTKDEQEQLGALMKKLGQGRN